MRRRLPPQTSVHLPTRGVRSPVHRALGIQTPPRRNPPHSTITRSTNGPRPRWHKLRLRPTHRRTHRRTALPPRTTTPVSPLRPPPFHSAVFPRYTPQYRP